jgi:hypothetical protein
MSHDKFDDTCKGCPPAILDVTTGLKLSDDHPVMQAVNRVWEGTTSEEREAFHRVCCQNSRDPKDLAVMKMVADRIQKSILN